MDSRLAKWLRWLATICDDVQQLVIAKQVFWVAQDLIRHNKSIQKPSLFYRYLSDTYVAYSMMAIRRQIKIDRESISLARLMDELANHPSCLSRRYYTGLYEGHASARIANGHFDKFCDSAGADHISAVIVHQDIDVLRRVTTRCEEFADKRIAHRDKRDPNNLPRYGDIGVAIDALDQLCVKYLLLFRADATLNGTLMPTILYDWQAIFDHPWRLVQCKASTKSGARCRRNVQVGGNYCSLHEKNK